MKVVMTNSFRGGTGKSTIISNLANYLASFGLRTIIIDADVSSPGIHAIFGLDHSSFDKTVTDYILGGAKPSEIVYDISENLDLPEETLYIAPASIDAAEIAQVLKKNLKGEKILKAIPQIAREFEPDFILIDTHPGLNEEVLVALEKVDLFLNIVRPDNQDYQGLEVMAGISNKLNINSYAVLNKVPKKLNNPAHAKKVRDRFGMEVAGVLPFSMDIMDAQSSFVFTDRYPGHEYSKAMQKLAFNVFGVKPREHLEMMQYILNTIEKVGQVSMTELQKEKNVYIPKAKFYLNNMIERGFIDNRKDKYSITAKGKMFLKKYNAIKRFVVDFRL